MYKYLYIFSHYFVVYKTLHKNLTKECLGKENLFSYMYCRFKVLSFIVLMKMTGNSDH